MDKMTKKLERAYLSALKAVADAHRTKSRLAGGPTRVPRDQRHNIKAQALGEARQHLKRLKNILFSSAARQYKIGPEPKISPDADELLLYGDNDEQTYRTTQAVRKNMAKKMRDGLYSHKLAVKGWEHVADVASQRYKKEIGTEGIDFANRGSGSFAHNTATRREVADYLAWRFVKWAQEGEYNQEDWAA